MFKPVDYIDNFLNSITMYRLTLYYLIGLVCIAVLASFAGILSYSPLGILFSACFLTVICWVTNEIFSKVFEAPTNVESVYITALILVLIVNIPKTFEDMLTLFWIGVLSMATKYIFAINKKHIFNPAAVAIVLCYFFLNQPASWWVGNQIMMPFVLIGGLLITRKIRREDLVFTFFFVVITLSLALDIVKGGNMIDTLNKLFLHSSLLFLGFVMLTEPLTTPPTHTLQLMYGALTGFLFLPQVHIGTLYSTPELALVIGNIFSYVVSPKEKLMLYLKERIQISPDTYDFIFNLKNKFNFTPGQYMEWTLSHNNPDNRGNRRYLTIASSPTENDIRIGVKFYEPSSTFKKSLLNLDNQTPVVASQLAGDFVLARNPQTKYVFVAGGIGITPFRSILKYLIDTQQKRDIIMIVSNRHAEDIVYEDILEQAVQLLNIKVVHTLTDTSSIPANWTGKTGRLTPQMIMEIAPDFKERIFYLSGPHAMVKGFEELLKNLHVSDNHIKKDFFPGFA